MADLTAEQIESVNDISITSVDVPEWGGTVYLRLLPVGDHESLVDWTRNADGKIEGFQAAYLQRCLCHKDGTLMFKDSVALSKKSSAVIGRLFSAAQKHNGVGTNAVEEAAKN